MPKARYFKEANTVLSIRGVAPKGPITGILVSILLWELGYWWAVIPCLVGGLYLGRKLAEDPHLVSSIMLHLWRGGAKRYLVANPVEPPVKVIIQTPEGPKKLADWLGQEIASKAEKVA